MNTKVQRDAGPFRGRMIAYWTTTTILIVGMLSGGASQLFQVQYQTSTFARLGYPLYLLTIIGVWKMAGSIALLLPHSAALKTAVYAGLFFIVTTAAVSHVVQGDFINAIAPLMVAAIAVAAYRLNPHLSPVSAAAVSVSGNVSNNSEKNNRTKKIAYWAIMIILEFVLLSGGIGELFHLWGTVEGTVNQLGYPMYFLSIIGIWKILGAIALLFPGFWRLQQWAFAGIFFHFTGAAASIFASGELSSFHLIAPLIFAGLTIAAWMLQASFQKELSSRLRLSLQRRYAV